MIRLSTGNKKKNLDQWYSSRENAVFYENQLMFKADMGSFQSLSHRFGKDRAHIYYKGEVLSIADYQSFNVNKKTGIGEDKLGLKIFDIFESSPSPTYILHNNSGIECPKNMMLSFGMKLDAALQLLGSPWESFTSQVHPKVGTTPTKILSKHYRHLGLTLGFNAQQALVHFRFRPDYDHPLGCKVFLQEIDLFNKPLLSLQDVENLGFNILKKKPEEAIAYHPDYNVYVLLYSGGAMNSPSGEEIYPASSYFIVDCQMFSRSFHAF